jgi:hypothetical protein
MAAVWSWTDRNLCACRGDLNRPMIFSRWRMELFRKNAGVDARLSGHFLEGQWAFPGEGTMPSSWIVKPVDVLKQGSHERFHVS